MENLYNDDDRQYLQMMQENISRMANNSTNCKTWLITIVAAMLAIGCNIEALRCWLLLTLVPIIIFWYLDTFYLRLERGMRNRQSDFINKVRAIYQLPANVREDERQKLMFEYHEALYDFSPKKDKTDDKTKGFVSTLNQLFSKSVLPVYGTLLFVEIFITIILNWKVIIRFCS